MSLGKLPSTPPKKMPSPRPCPEHLLNITSLLKREHKIQNHNISNYMAWVYSLCLYEIIHMEIYTQI